MATMTGKRSYKSKNNVYLNGVNGSTMKKIAKFWFTEYYMTFMENEDSTWIFKIIVKHSTEDWMIKRFKAYWGAEVVRESK